MFFFSSRRRHTRCALVTGVQTCALPICLMGDGPLDEEESAKPALEHGRSEECLLVVEDDDDVRGYTVELLREIGYRVLEAHDGPSALRLLERQDAPIQLLFTDVVMPGM